MKNFYMYFVFFAVLNVFLMRPAALGQDYTVIAILFALGLFFLVVYYFDGISTIKTTLSIKQDFKVLYAFCFIYWIVSLAQAFFFQKSDFEFVLKEILSSLVIIVCYTCYLIDKKTNDYFFRFFCNVISFLGWSSLITFILSFFVDIQDIYIFKLPVGGYEYDDVDGIMQTGSIFFPLSMIYANMTVDDIHLLRFCNFFREAGIYQAIACFFVLYEFLHRRSKIVLCGLILGVLLTFSSLGVVILLVSLISCYLSVMGVSIRRKIIVSGLSLIVLYPAAMYMPFIGLQNKAVTHSASITDRTESMMDGIDRFSLNPLGDGLFSTKKQNSGINMISAIGQYGFINFIILTLILSGWRLTFSNSALHKVMACFPLLITAMFSQPIAGAPMLYILTMADFDEEDL